MQKGTLHFASLGLSAADDIDDELIEDGMESDEIDLNPTVIHLGDDYVEINGYVFHEDWDEIDPPGSDDEPGIPHEVVMAEIRALLKKPIDHGR